MPAGIYITKSDIHDLVKYPISVEEFKKMVDNDPSLVWVEESNLVSKEELARIQPHTSALWIDDPQQGSLWFVLDDDGTIPFGYRKGSTQDIYLEKIIDIAKKLKANVQADDGEILFKGGHDTRSANYT